MRLIFNIIVVLFISSLNSLADTYEERRFIIEAKLRILPSIKIMEIDTKLEIKEDNYDYIFDIKSKNIVKFINEINGIGKVKGKIFDNQYIPSNYTYSYKGKK